MIGPLGLGALVTFELLTLAVALRAVRRLPSDMRPRTRASWLLAVLGVHVVLDSLVGGVLSFARLNSAPAYLGAALLLGAWGCLPARARVDLRACVRRVWSTSPALPHVAVAAACAALGLPLAPYYVWRPTYDVDSALTLASLLTWAGNQTTPYTYVWFDAYPAFWELGFLPALVLGRSDMWLWLRACEALLIVALGLYTLARQLDLPAVGAALAAASACSLWHYWRADLSGPATLKNDALVAAGFVLMILALQAAAERAAAWRGCVWLALALPFLTTKYSGLGIAGLGGLLFLVLARRAWREAPRRTLATALALAALVLVTTGHFYIHNLVVHANPVAPVRVVLAGRTLFPGVLDLSGTSILSNLGQRRLYANVSEWPSIGGWAFPALMMLGAMLCAAHLARRAIPRLRRPGGSEAAVAALVLAGWLSYLGAFWSAGTAPGDVSFFTHLHSLRYALGPLAVCELIALAWLSRVAGPAPAALVAALSCTTRLAVLQAHAGGGAGLATLTCQAAALAWVALWAHRPRWGGVLLAAGIAGGLVFGVPRAFDAGRSRWIGSYYPGVWERFRDEPGADIGVLPGGNAWRPMSVVAGARLQHRTRPVFAAQLTEWRASERPDHVVQFVHPMDFGLPQAARDLRVSAESLLDAGYFVESLSKRALIATRRPLREQLVLLDVANANGVEQVGGKLFLWVGQGETCFELASTRAGRARVSFEGSGGPSLPDVRAREVELTLPSGARATRRIEHWPDVTWRFPVRRGRNRLCLRSLDTPSLTRLANGDERPLLLGISDPRFTLVEDRDSSH